MLEIRTPDSPAAEPITSTMQDFLAANADMEPEDLRAVEGLPLGGEIAFGGGAAVLFVVRRTA